MTRPPRQRRVWVAFADGSEVHPVAASWAAARSMPNKAQIAAMQMIRTTIFMGYSRGLAITNIMGNA
jgi:hypothetical protein